MEAGVNVLGRAGCRYTKEYVCKISGQYIHFYRSYDNFCNGRTFVLIYRPHPVLPYCEKRELQTIFERIFFGGGGLINHDLTSTTLGSDESHILLGGGGGGGKIKKHRVGVTDFQL